MTEHLIALLLIAGVPPLAVVRYRRFRRRVEDGVPGARMREYGRSIRTQWLVTLIVLALWIWRGRPLDGLGLGLPLTWRSGLAGMLALVGLVLLADQLRRARRDPELMDEVRRQLEPVRALMPTGPAEYRRFAALGVTAGICEEILYRGFLIWYVAQDTAVWAAVLFSALIFGLGHLYQGAQGVVKTGAVGLAMGGLYVLAGTLWPAMLLHAGIDVINGRLGYEAAAFRPDSTSRR